MITDVAGVMVGHWTDPDAMTGCTVVLLPEGTVASGEVRGGAPATREFDLLDPLNMVDRLDAVVLTGGSAFGLAAADGVMAFCEQAGRGVPTSGGPVPIVVAIALYDLAVGSATVRPTAAAGRHAAEAATGGTIEVGLVGAGAGATVDKWRGLDQRRPGGLVTATRRAGDLVVSALFAVNSYGEPGGRPDDLVAHLDALAHAGSVGDAAAGREQFTDPPAVTNTTIGVVATNARLDKVGCQLAARSAHDGLARAIVPTHTSVDGDAVVVAATGEVDATVAHVRILTLAAVEAALLQIPDASDRS